MQFNAHSQVGARFKLIVRKASDDSIARETNWFKNIVLDTGLARMSVGTWIDRCCVGTGNSSPVVTQTALDSFLASTTTIQSSSAGTQTTTTPYYRWTKVTWRFGQGVAAGNISEVGLGWSDTNLWNRALIKDANGNPTTITVLSDEYLDVVSEIRNYPAESTTGSFDLLDKTGAVISTYSVQGSAYINTGSVLFQKLGMGNLFLYTGVKQSSVTQEPLGFLDTITSPTISYPTPTSMRAVYTLPLSKGNGTVKSFVTTIQGLMQYSYETTASAYKFEISPTITKTSSQIMTYTFEMSWGRYTG